MLKEHLIRVNSVASSSDEPSEVLELRSRGRAQTGVSQNRHDEQQPSWLNNRVLIDRAIKPDDTLNKIALQYSVQVADIKRANNIVNDQEIYALPSIKVPVSRFFVDTLEDRNDQVPVVRHSLLGSSSAPKTTDDDRRPLLDFEDDNDSDEMHRARVEALLERTDAAVAQVRENLPSPGLEGGAFHFVDATSPDTTMRNIWLLIFAVVFIFAVVPLLLTLLEEKSEAEAEIRHHAKTVNPM